MPSASKPKASPASHPSSFSLSSVLSSPKEKSMSLKESFSSPVFSSPANGSSAGLLPVSGARAFASPTVFSSKSKARFRLFSSLGLAGAFSLEGSLFAPSSKEGEEVEGELPPAPKTSLSSTSSAGGGGATMKTFWHFVQRTFTPFPVMRESSRRNLVSHLSHCIIIFCLLEYAREIPAVFCGEEQKFTYI